jgi:hypothetical protein
MAGIVGPYEMENVRMPTWLLRFDKYGTCTSPATRQALLDQLRDNPPSDVILFSHGWNNDFNDAAGLYARFLQSFEQLLGEHPPKRAFNPVFIGVVWPSAWLVFDDGPNMAAAVGAVGAKDSASEQSVASELAERLAASGKDASLKRFYELLDKDRLSTEEAKEFGQLIAPAFTTVVDDEATGERRANSAEDLLFVMQALQGAQTARRGKPAPVNPYKWGESAADVATGGAPEGAAAPAAVQAASLLNVLDPRNALRLFSVYQMKDRAGTVGYSGVAALLRDVLKVTEGQGTALHAAGHSYGCKVMLSAICEPSPLPRAVSSLLLLQPAISHLCFADTVPGSGNRGGYREAMNGSRLRGPIYSTYSNMDFALHSTFHLALRRSTDLGEVKIAPLSGTSTSAGSPPSHFAALGGYGPRGASQQLVDPMPAAGVPYPASDAPIVAFDGSRDVIKGHGDVTDSAAAWALYQLVFR